MTKTYRSTYAVDNVSLTVAAGEIVGLLSPNGAGKTTLVELIAGVRTPDRGQVAIWGMDPRRDRSRVR